MSGKKMTTTTTTTEELSTVQKAQKKGQKGKRLTSLSPRGEQMLSSGEESVLRMHHGISLSGDANLATNGINDDVMAQLREMELKAFEATGRGDDLDDVPDLSAGTNRTTSRIVDKLSSKT